MAQSAERRNAERGECLECQTGLGLGLGLSLFGIPGFATGARPKYNGEHGSTSL